MEIVVDMDTEARLYSYPSNVTDTPLMLLLDFAAAFPSLIRQWMFAVLDAIECPPGFINAVEGIYFFNSSCISAEGNTAFVF